MLGIYFSIMDMVTTSPQCEPVKGLFQSLLFVVQYKFNKLQITFAIFSNIGS
jgi:hypothetical protein